MSNQKGAKVVALLVLIGIIFSIIGTGILFIIERNNEKKELNKKIEEYIKNQSGSLEILTGKLENSSNSGSGTKLQ